MQRNSSWPGDYTLHSKAEYICADLSLALRFSLAVVRRTIHFRELIGPEGGMGYGSIYAWCYECP
jgi:hypothetical protein